MNFTQIHNSLCQNPVHSSNCKGGFLFWTSEDSGRSAKSAKSKGEVLFPTPVICPVGSVRLEEADPLGLKSSGHNTNNRNVAWTYGASPAPRRRRPLRAAPPRTHYRVFGNRVFVLFASGGNPFVPEPLDMGTLRKGRVLFWPDPHFKK